MVSTHFNNVRFDIMYTKFLDMYAAIWCQLWDYTHASVKKFDVTWCKAIRRILSLPYITHCDLLHYISDDLPLKA